MPETLDERIIRVAAKLDELKRRRTAVLQERLLRLQRKRLKFRETKRARKSPQRMDPSELRKLLQQAVEEAGEGGISALAAAGKTGASYAQVRPLMIKHFKRTGAGRTTRFMLRRRRTR